MKKIVLFLSLVISHCPAFAQPTLTAIANTPTPGFSFNYAYKSSFTPSTAGAAQIWDFSAITFPPASTTHAYVACAATPFCADNPGSTVVAQDPNGGYTYYLNNSDSLSLLCSYPTSGEIQRYSDPEIILQFPMTYGDSFADSFHYYLPQTNGGAIYFFRGSDSVVADGWGTLKTPVGTFPNAIRITRTEHYVLSNTYNGPGTQQYGGVYHTWYDTAHKDLLYETYATLPGMAFGSSFSIYAKYAQAGTGVNDPGRTGAETATIYPNPCGDYLNIAYDSPPSHETIIQITDVFGRKLIESLVGSTSGNIQLDFRNLPPGFYLYRILENGMARQVGKVIKR